MEKALVLFETHAVFREELRRRLTNMDIVFHSGDSDVSPEVLNNTAIIFGFPRLDLISRCPRLKWLQLPSAGVDAFIGRLSAGVILSNASGAYGPAVSEYMTGVLFELNLRLHQYRDEQNRQTWRRRGSVRSILGSIALCVGMGDIGGHFAAKMKALGAYVIGVTRGGVAAAHSCADELLWRRRVG
ncbi:MAG: hypothetical protein LBS84_07670 [Clostridiales bacterium]|nr:hypothetical protein [Clostridiales bacterium]